MNKTDERLPLVSSSIANPHSSVIESTVSWSHIYVETQPTCLSSQLSASTRSIFTTKKLEDKSRVLLYDLTGIARPGQILAILGTSGVGKTTLLKVLSGHYSDNRSMPTGQVHLNGCLTTDTQRQKAKSIGYVEQQEVFIETMTLEEHLIFQAMLRMPHELTDDARRLCVKNTHTRLHLTKCMKTTIDRLSGGEKKRLALASVFLTEPHIILIDEPTSGLDAYLAMSIMRMIRSMAVEQGKTIIVVMHQPTNAMLDLVDKICLLVQGGRQAFFGTKDEALDFFVNECHLSSSSLDGFIEQLAAPLDSTNDQDGVIAQKVAADEYAKSRQATLLESTIASHLESPNKINVQNTLDDIGRVAFRRQLKWLLWRSFVADVRHPMRAIFVFIRTFLFSVLFGLIYFQLCRSGHFIQNVNALDLVVINLLIMTSANAILSTMPTNINIGIRETNQGMYGIFAFYLSMVFHDIPTFTLLPLLLNSIVYWMSGMNNTWYHYLSFVAIGILTCNTGGAFGHLIASFSSSIESAISIAIPTLQTLTIFSGFYLDLVDIPSVFRILQYISPYYYSYTILITLQWDSNGDTETSNCYQSQDMWKTTTILLLNNSPSNFDICTQFVDKNVDFLLGNLGFNIILFIMLFSVYHIIAFIVVWYRAHRRQLIQDWSKIMKNKKTAYQSLP